jgi:hypothetical protein
LEETNNENQSDRRSFLRTGAIAGAALVAGEALAEEAATSTGPATGDIDIPRFLAAAEILESDLWQQYNELGGIQDSEELGGSGNEEFTEKLKVLDGDMDQYVHDNTDDEFSHAAFINAFLGPIHAVNLDKFRTLKGSTATGVNPKKSVSGSPISRSLSSTPVIGRGTATQTIILISTGSASFPRPFRTYSKGRIRQSPEPMPT